ncbi:MAG: 4-carboxy-4-hydroxy-2-oxoadipate aldolase/oxaloacetate decarboxylase [Micropruina sp.]|uniref:4-carboxy-4-hydroxy-2-oxoadipate aldolase/oxaloacetate decarboxylase n=1 Tax=Micropruina sp. TaxID=2737536 RepID=UPI0039E5B65F
MIHVRTRIQRPDPALVAGLAQYSSATIHEAQGRLGAFDSGIKPIDRSMSFCGPAVTVVCAPQDNLMLQVGIHYAQAGDVLVVSAGEFTEAGTFGDVLGTAMHSKGLAALVTDSGVRDTADLIELGLPVFSRSVCIKGTVKETLGPINHPIVFGGQLVEPGDLIKGDADGVVLVKAADVGWVIDACAAREASEAELREKYRAGGTTIELCNLVEKLAAKGLLVED